MENEQPVAAETQPATTAMPEGVETQAAEGAGGEESQAQANPATPAPDKVFAALARKKAKLAAEKQALLAEKQKWEMEVSSRKHEFDELNKYRELNKLAKEDPVKFMESVGLDYSDVTKRILERDTPDEKIKVLAAELEAERKARIEREQMLEKHSLMTQQRQAEDKFLSIVNSNDKFKSLQLHEREELVAAGNQMADALRERLGHAPTLEQVAEALAKSAEDYQRKFYERLNSVYGSPVEKKSKTISNKMASDGMIVKDNMTHEERIKAAVRFMEQQEKLEMLELSRTIELDDGHILSGPRTGYVAANDCKT